MRMDILRALILILLPVLLFCGWTADSDTTVLLQTPGNGDIVYTMTPTFSWSAANANQNFTLQVALDRSFQEIAVNATNIAGFAYQVPPGILNRSRYYWRVGQGPSGRIVSWSQIWSFTISQAASSTVQVNATLDGQTWAGGLDCSVAGAGTTGVCSRVPEQYTTRPAGNYSLIYNSGGPAGASMSNIVPSSTQQLADGGVISFTLNFISVRAPVNVQAPGTIQIYAVHNGSPVSTSVNVSLSGPYSDTITFVPSTKYNMPAGNYYLNYNYGGPSYANFNSVSPGTSQYLSPGGSIVFTVQFGSPNYYYNDNPYDNVYYNPPGNIYYPPTTVVVPPPNVIVTPPGGYPPARPPTGGATPPSYRPPSAVPPRPPVAAQPIAAPPSRPPVQATPMPSQPRPPAPSVQPVQPRPMPSGGGGGGARPSPR
jgi:hypothetical protein